jgi:hypothetical protein
MELPQDFSILGGLTDKVKKNMEFFCEKFFWLGLQPPFP